MPHLPILSIMVGVAIGDKHPPMPVGLTLGSQILYKELLLPLIEVGTENRRKLEARGKDAKQKAYCKQDMTQNACGIERLESHQCRDIVLYILEIG